MKTFILGCNDRASLIVSRELSKLNSEIEIISFSSKCIALKSKSVNKFHLIKNQENIDEIFKEVIQLVEKGSFVIPINDYFLTLVLNFFDEFKEKVIIPYKSKSSIIKMIDKYELIKDSKKLGISTPDSILIKSINSFNKLEFGKLSFPVILKPRFSCVIQNNRIISTSVKKINNIKDLEMQIRLNIGLVEIIIQNFIPGYGKAINFFSIDGKIKNFFQYERIHEPGFGGGSSLRRSSIICDKIYAYSKKIVYKNNYSGIGMIEFRYNSQNNKFYLMEVNSRFWGSISLPIFAGINFPKILYNYYLKNKISESHYLSNLYSRHLLKDIKWIFIKLKKFKFSLFFNEFKRLLVRHSKKTETFDIEKVDDIKPGIFQLIYFFENFFIKVHEIISRVLVMINQYSYRRYNRKRLLNLIKENNMKIVFVCRGNIIRSAFSEKYFNSNSNLISYSCGTLNKSNRLSPINAIIAAQKEGIDLNNHKSIYLNDLNISKKECVFLVMNAKQYITLKQKFKCKNVYFLGILNPKGKMIIKDPYYDPHNIKVYDTIYSQIKSNIDFLI